MVLALWTVTSHFGRCGNPMKKNQSAAYLLAYKALCPCSWSHVTLLVVTRCPARGNT